MKIKKLDNLSIFKPLGLSKNASCSPFRGLGGRSSLTYLSLGSNLGDKKRHLDDAIQLLSERVGEVKTVSTFRTFEPWGYKSDNEFVNAVVLIQTTLTPLDLLAETKQIEKEMGRLSKTVKTYSDRIIDIDILLYNKEIIDLPTLKIPHPLILERDFVLLPLLEIAPDLIHPVFLKRFSEYISKESNCN